jgi:hypothetical protein
MVRMTLRSHLVSLSVVSALVVASTTALTLDASAAVAAPSNVTASAAYGALQVSWSDAQVAKTTFVVSSTPAGKGCKVTGATSCTIPVSDLTPWQFTVTATHDGATSAPSAPSAVVPAHLVIVLAGQSNAEGARSYVVDPVTHVNYFDAPYASTADTVDRLTWLPWPTGDMASPPSSDPVALNTPQLLSGTAIFGPEISLARTLYSYDPADITVIKATYPSTALANRWRPSQSNGLYVQMCNFVRATMSADAARGQFDALGSFIWFQGESDALLHNANYKNELVGFIHHVRHDLPLDEAATIVVAKESILQREIFEQSHHGCASDNCARALDGNTIIRNADDWVGHHLAHVVVVDSEGLDRTASSSYMHLSNVGELALGAKIAVRLEPRLALLTKS